MRTAASGVAAAILVASATAAAPSSAAPRLPRDPYVLVLGTAQDGGLPQVGCEEPACRRARTDPSARRLVSSLAVCDPRDGRRWLMDATPDLREQVALVAGHPPGRSLPGPRPPLFDGVFLTHAHVGHYLGLAQLGREAHASRSVPVHGTERLCRFLEENGPWDLLVRLGHVAPVRLVPGVAVPLAADLSVTAIQVPHRDEYSDTVAYVVKGPSRSLLHVPDIDKWDRWDRRLEDVLASVDVALLDGTFFEDGEVPGRAMSEIPHPFIVETLRRLAPLPLSERRKVAFIHLNHTNPAAARGGKARRAIRAAGMAVAAEGDVHPL